MSFYPLCALLIGYSYRLYLPQSKLYKSLSPLVTFSHLCSHISGLSGDQLGDQLGDKVTNFCHPIKNRPKAVNGFVQFSITTHETHLPARHPEAFLCS